MDNNYSIYKFTFSDGKVYIGQTSQPVEERWNNGEGYIGQEVYIPITLDGWKKVQKEILHTGLNAEQANKLERYYIKKFNSRKNGYNKNNGNINLNLNLDKIPLRLICDSITVEEKIQVQYIILSSLNGQQGNLLKLMWFFILNDNTNIILNKQQILTKLNIASNKYYEARNKLLKLGWIEINEKQKYLKIKYSNILNNK